ncbi:N-acetyltransferase family protein [Pseudoxanthomonas sp. UTMC 1351]|uniref:N-acetyltransferase family protein n=1 Tax=Pseudoxanthomonas sp. UTMC 1351 TaxID=2695853 RepID=UPI0034CFE9FC
MNPTESSESDPNAAPPYPKVRQCREDEAGAILTIINSAAEVYRGTIPKDCWHEPYMSATELQSELAAGVVFAGCEIDGVLAGVMGSQHVRNVDLIRHAYVLPAYQGHGVGSALLAYLRVQTDRTVLIGTWSAAKWAIRFYERHGFQLVPETAKALLLRTYWTISDRQIETSVVLSDSLLTGETARMLAERIEDSDHPCHPAAL